MLKEKKEKDGAFQEAMKQAAGIVKRLNVTETDVKADYKPVSLADAPKTLKGFYDEYNATLVEISSDGRFSDTYKQALIDEQTTAFEASVNQFSLDFEKSAEIRRAALEAVLNEPPQTVHEEQEPANLLSSERALWKQLAATKALTAEMLKLQKTALYEHEIEYLDAGEIVQAFKETEDAGYKEALKVYGVRRLQRLAKSDAALVNHYLEMRSAIDAETERMKTPRQRKAEQELAELNKQVGKFNLLLRTHEDARKRKGH